MNWLQKEKWGVFFKSVIWTVLITFTVETFGFQSTAYAQSYLQSLPMPGTMINLSPAYAPVLIKGIKTYPDNPFRFDFFIDPGEEHLDSKGISQESNKLIKYFLASLTVPENDLWVNLSPYEKDRIMPQGFGVTEMGRDLLAQDYLLKQISASLLDPTKPKGEEFWKKIYQKANLPQESINTFNKVWIVPDSAEVYTKDGNAFVIDSHLKVMLEEDQSLDSQRAVGIDAGAPSTAENNLTPPSPLFKKEGERGTLASQTVRDVIVPAIEKEVNEGENFAMLRQIYHAMILATWFKRHLRQSLFSKVYVGQNKVAGVDVDDKEIKEKIYQQYLAAFKKGVFNFIREDFDEVSQETVPRKYFAGGVSFTEFASLDGAAGHSAYRETDNPARLKELLLRSVGFLDRSFYRISSVVVNKQGVNWYDSMNLVAPVTAAASAVVTSSENQPALSVGKLFGKFSLRKAAGIAFATVALFSSLGFGSQAQAAQFSYDSNRGMIVHIEKNDTMGSIVATLKKQQTNVDSSLLSGKLWGKAGAVEKVAQAMQLSDKDTIIAGKDYVIPSSFLAATDVQRTVAQSKFDKPMGLKTTVKKPPVSLVEQIPSVVHPIPSVVPSIPLIVPDVPNFVTAKGPANNRQTTEGGSFLSTVQYPFNVNWLNNVDVQTVMRPLDYATSKIQEVPPAVSWTVLGLMLASFGLMNGSLSRFGSKVKARLRGRSSQPLVNASPADPQVMDAVRAATVSETFDDFSLSHRDPLSPTEQELAAFTQKDNPQQDFAVSVHTPTPPDKEEARRAQEILAQTKKSGDQAADPKTASNSNFSGSMAGLADEFPESSNSNAYLIFAAAISLAILATSFISSFTGNDLTSIPFSQWLIIGCGNFGFYWVADKNENPEKLKGYWQWRWKESFYPRWVSVWDQLIEIIYPRWVSDFLRRHLEGLTLRGGESAGMSGFLKDLIKRITRAIIGKVLKAKRGGDLFESLDRDYRATVKKAVKKGMGPNPESRVHGVTGHVRLPTGGASLLEAAHPFTTTDNALASGLFGLWRAGQGDFAIEDNWRLTDGGFTIHKDQVIVSIAANGDNLRTIPKFRFAQADPDGSKLVQKLIMQGNLEEVSQTTVRLVRNEDGSVTRPPELKEAQYDELWEDLQKSDLQVSVFGQQLDTRQLRDYYAAIYQYELGDAYQWVKERDEDGKLQEPHRIVNGDSPPIALQILFGFTQGNWKASLRYAYTNAIHRNRQEVVDNVMDLKQIDSIKQVIQRVFVSHSQELSRPGLFNKDKNYFDLWVTEEMVEADERWRPQFEALQSFRGALFERFKSLRDEIENGTKATAEGTLLRRWRHNDDETLRTFVDLLVERFFVGDRATSVREFAETAQGTFGVQIKDSLHPDSFTLYVNGQGLALGYSIKGRYVEFSSEHSAMMYDHSPKPPLENIIFLDSQSPGQMADVTVYDNEDGSLFSLDIYSFAERRYLSRQEIKDNSYPQTEDNPYYRAPLQYKDPRNKTAEDLEKTPAAAADLHQKWQDPQSHIRRSAKAMLDKFVSRDLELYLKSNSLVYGRIQAEIVANLTAIINNAIDVSTEEGRATKARILHQVQNDSVIPYLRDYVDRIIEEKADELARQMIAGEITEDHLPEIQEEFERSLQPKFYSELKRIGELIVDHHFDYFQQWLEQSIAKGEQGALIGAGEIDAVSMGYESSDNLGQALNKLYAVVFPGMRTLNLSSNAALSLNGKDGVGRRSVAMVTSKSGGTSPSKSVIARLKHIMPGRVFAATSRSDTLIGFALGQKYLPDSPFCERLFYTGDYFPSEAISAGEFMLFINEIELVIYLAKYFRKMYPHRQPFGMTMTNEEIGELERLRDELIVGEAQRLTGVNQNKEAHETSEHAMLVKNGKQLGKTLLEGPINNLVFRMFVFGIFMLGAPMQNIVEHFSGAPLPPVSEALGFFSRLMDFTIAVTFQWMFTSWIYRWFSDRPRWARLGGTTLAVNDPSLLVRESLEMYAVKLGSLSPGSMHMHVLSTDPTDTLAAELLPRIVRGTIALFGMPYDSTVAEQVALSTQQTAAVKNGILGQYMKAGAEIFMIFRGKDNRSVPDAVTHKMNIGVPDIHLPSPRVLEFYQHSFDVYGRHIAGKVFLQAAYEYATTLRLGKKIFQIWDRSKTHFRTGVLSTAIPAMPSHHAVVERGTDPFKDFPPKKKQSENNSLSPAEINTEVASLEQGGSNDRQRASSSLQNEGETNYSLQAPGGIDLNPRMLKMNVTEEVSASSAVLPQAGFLLDPGILNTMPADRFEPLIIEVVPINSVEMFLGMSTPAKNPELALAVP